MVYTLFAAAILGDVNAVAAQLSGRNATLSKVNVKGETVMHVAAKHGNTELVKYLALKHSTAPYAKDLCGRTPLHLAALYGKADVVVELRKLPQFDPACVDHNMQTPLLLAALNGHIPVIRELLNGPKKHQQLTAVDRHKHTALHLAVRCAHVNTVRFLLKHFEAKPVIKQLTDKDHLGWTVVHSAAGVGSADIIEEIFKICWDSVILKQVNDTTWSPLHVASWFGHAEIVKLMCGQMGFCVNTTANSLERLTPLHMAAHNGHDAVVDYLLSHEKLQVGHCDVLRRTALHYAARQGHTSVVRKLLRPSGSSLSVNATDVNGLTALHLAAREGHELIVCILLEERADVNAQTESSIISKSLLDNVLSSDSPHEIIVDPIILEADCWCISQMTPLHLAARSGHMAVVQQLLKHPDINVRALDGHGLMPQDWAEVRNVRKEFLNCLEQAPRLAGETSARASKKKLQILREEMMKWEKTAVVMPTSTFHSFQSMQYTTEAYEDLEKVGNTGKQDGKVSDPKPSNNFEKEDTRGISSHSKSCSEDMDTTARVLQEIYKIAAQDERSGNTPLHVAVKCDHRKAVEILVKCRPMDDVNVKNSDGDTPLALAFEKNDVEICKLILQNSEKVEDDLREMLKKAIAKNWLAMSEILLGDARTRTGGDIAADLLDEATHSTEKRFLDSLLRRATMKERLLQERKEHLDAAGAMLVIAALIASITYQGDLQPPQGKHHWAHLLFDWLNASAFYSAVSATIAVASGSLPVRHIYELVDTRDSMRISRGISCVLLIMSSACVVWAYAAAGFSRASDSKLFPVGNGAGAMVTTLFLFWFLKHYIQLYKPFCHSSYSRNNEQNNEGCICSLCRRVARIVRKLPSMCSRQETGSLEHDLLRNGDRSVVAV